MPALENTKHSYQWSANESFHLTCIVVQYWYFDVQKPLLVHIKQFRGGQAHFPQDLGPMLEVLHTLQQVTGEKQQNVLPFFTAQTLLE